MDPKQNGELLRCLTDRLFKASLAINSAEQVVQNSGTPQAGHVRRQLREAINQLDAALREIRTDAIEQVRAHTVPSQPDGKRMISPDSPAAL